MTMKTHPPFIGSQRIVQLLALLAIITISLGRSHALGLRIPNQDPEALGRANAFAATANNPSAIYYNPAGITQLPGHNLQVSSLAYFNIYADYESPSGAKVENHHEILPVPAFHYTYTPDDSRFTLGLGVYAPFGLAMKWPGNAPFRNTGIEGGLDYITVNPVVAYKIHDSLSLAVGPTINLSRINLQRGIGMIPGDSFRFKGDGMDYGFNAGLLWQPHSKWSFGLSYRSATEVDYEGTATAEPAPPFPGSFNSSASVKYPQIVIVGVSYRPTTNWNFEFDVDWADWSTLDEITISQHDYKGGTEYRFTLRARSFLHNQVRSIVGTLEKVGSGAWQPLDVKTALDARNRAACGPVCPPQGLYLTGVKYPDDVFSTETKQH